MVVTWYTSAVHVRNSCTKLDQPICGYQDVRRWLWFAATNLGPLPHQQFRRKLFAIDNFQLLSILRKHSGCPRHSCCPNLEQQSFRKCQHLARLTPFAESSLPRDPAYNSRQNEVPSAHTIPRIDAMRNTLTLPCTSSLVPFSEFVRNTKSQSQLPTSSDCREIRGA
jgi:hypothetical protein